MNAVVPAGGNGSGLMPQNLTDAMRLAEMMAKGKLVPEHLRNPSDMLMVIEQACRWGMSPFAVAQCTAIVRGKISYEGKLVAAAVQSSGVLSSRINYAFSGEGATRAVTASATIKGENTPREVVVTLASAKTDNEHWKKSPDQMLTYHAARVWARRHTPEVMLGIYSPEEFESLRDAFSGPTIDAVAPHDPSPPTKAISNGDTSEVREAKQRAWMDKLELELAHAVSLGSEAVDGVLARPDVNAARDKAREMARDRIEGMIANAIAMTSGTETTAPNDEAHAGVFADPESDPFAERVPA